jgi:pentatricopeptide repeat protein
MSLYQALVSLVVEAESEGEAEALLEEMIAEDHEIDELYEINESQVSN